MAKRMYLGVDGLARKVKKMYLGVEGAKFTQPVLTSDGVLGGNSFAVYSNSVSVDFEAYKAFSSSMSEGYSSNVNPATETVYYVMYNPVPISISKITFTNQPQGFTSSSPKNFSVDYSNDNSVWTKVSDYTNTNNTTGGQWSIEVNSGYHKYWRLSITSANTENPYVNFLKINLEAMADSSVSVARKVKKGYIGIGGVARPFWTGGELAYWGLVGTLDNLDGGFIPAAASVGDYALSMGGIKSLNNINTVYAFDRSLTRTLPTPLSTNAGSPTGGMIDGYALCIGGSTSGANFRTAIDAYDASLTRTTPAQLSGSGGNISVAYNANYLLAAGFSSVTASRGLVNAFDHSLTRFIPGSLSPQRQDVAGGTAGPYALFMGGMTFSSQYSAASDAYDVSLTRTTPTQLSTARTNLAGGSIGGCAICMGGRDGSSPLTIVDAYNDSLTRSSVTPLSSARSYVTGVSLDEYALCVGGSDSNTAYVTTRYTTVDAYDNSLTHSLPPPFTDARAETATATVGDYLLLLSGNGTNPATVEAYTIG